MDSHDEFGSYIGPELSDSDSDDGADANDPGEIHRRRIPQDTSPYPVQKRDLHRRIVPANLARSRSIRDRNRTTVE